MQIQNLKVLMKNWEDAVNNGDKETAAHIRSNIIKELERVDNNEDQS